MDCGVHLKKTKTQDSGRSHEQQQDSSLATTLEHIMGQLDVLTQVWFAVWFIMKMGTSCNSFIEILDYLLLLCLLAV